MVVDTSALIAVIRKDPGWPLLIDLLLVEPEPLMSAANWVEVGLVTISRFPAEAAADARRLRREFAITIRPVEVAHAELAWTAFRRYGKGRHRAALNFGDCFAYALARHLRQPLLFKGDDFGHTDVLPALPG